MADALQVELVAADRIVWSGEATQVNARTADGEIGILRGHTPVMSLLAPSVVEIVTDGSTVIAAVDSGFISVANDRVSLLSEHARLGSEVDLEAARAELEEARGEDGDEARIAGLEAQVKAGERAS
ncbi:MAG: F0F1 ATP synthase subunit epsilon [Nocardioidaceae bacterium]|nr:F0F1 ATP synthase subunit epsilon [Nocardioidaceae bacterium]MCL2614016.1 F0F1 ATP synthase subunit epsilon [Nocardioidaceae bacterium]